MNSGNDGIKIIDCTIRDGGLVNNWGFSKEFVSDVYQSLSEAGVDYMEIGYKNSPKLLTTPNAGPWAFLTEALLEEVIPQKSDTKLSAIVDIGRVDLNDIRPSSESLIDLIRVACYAKDTDKAIDLVNRLGELGYETSINIMAVSTVKESDLNEALEKVSDCPVDMVYVVDSFGNLMNRDIEYLVQKYQRVLGKKKLGIHAHNNMQMAFSNTVLAMEKGVTCLDASLYGMGRAAGNCPTELLIGYLRTAKYELAPILGVLERRMLPLRQEEEWGYIIPYLITGVLNEHPRVAMALRASEDKDKYVQFYDQLTSEEPQGHR